VPDLELVVDVLDAHHLVGDVRSEPLRAAILDDARERDLGVLDADFDIARVDRRMPRQPVADVLSDPLVAPSVAARPAAEVALPPGLAAPPAGQVVTGAE
jgi:hypothetical protein